MNALQNPLALLGRRGIGQGDIASRLRLDEVGFRAPADGETASGAVLTVGKRLSQNLYVSYESSLSGALGTLFIFYDLTRNLTLMASADYDKVWSADDIRDVSRRRLGRAATLAGRRSGGQSRREIISDSSARNRTPGSGSSRSNRMNSGAISFS